MKKIQTYHMILLREAEEFTDMAAAWFCDKWKIPQELYRESIEECQKRRGIVSEGIKMGVPQWYILMDENKIIGGLGVIDNDFHKRIDLWPNICAVYVEEEYRKAGLAKEMLQFVYNDLKEMGIKKAYLITDHTDFYEKCGFSFYGMIEENGGDMVRTYQIGEDIH